MVWFKLVWSGVCYLWGRNESMDGWDAEVDSVLRNWDCS